ncbi:hypothetical protein D3C78_1880040 [compost metagenome]
MAHTLQDAGLIDDGTLFRVEANAQPEVSVLADPRAPEALKASLRDALARLPVKVALRD